MAKTQNQTQTEVVNNSQSEKIRQMYASGMTKGEIAKAIGKRYQTVWRTLHRPYKGVIPADVEVATSDVEVEATN